MLNLLLFISVLARCFLIIFLPMQVFYSTGVFANEKPLELLVNPSLEDISPSGGATGWTFIHWMSEVNENIVSRDENEIHTGGASLKITSVQDDDSQVFQSVSVEPETWYRLSAWVKTQNIPLNNNIGANIGIIDVMEHSNDLKGDNDWHELVVWGKTAKNQHDLKVVLRLGFYGSLTTGTAWFDDVSLTKSEPPEEAYSDGKIIPFTPDTRPSQDERPASASLPASLAIFVTVSFLLLAWLSLRERDYLYRNFGALSRGLMPFTKTWPAFGLLLFVILIKAFAAAFFIGYPHDVNTFSSWAIDVYERGFAGFYMPGYFADYPPGYISVLWLVGAMSSWLHVGYGTPEFLLLLKSPAMLADIAGVILLLNISKKDDNSRALAFVVALLWLFNPLAIITSAFWGQVDSIFTLILAMSLLLLEKKRTILAASLYAIAILFKPQALLVAPIALVALLSLRDIKLQCKVSIAFIVTFIVSSLPFTIFHEPTWIFKLYGNTLASYDYLTLNAFNLYALLGQNWLPNETLFLGMRVSSWAWVLTLSTLSVILLGVVIAGKKEKHTGRYLFAAFAVFLVFFVLGPKIHERYLFPAAFIGFTAFLIIRDKRVLWLAIGASLTTFINSLITLDFMLRLETSLVPNENIFLLICSIINVLLLIQTLRVGYDIFLRGNIQFLPEEKIRELLPTTTFTQQQQPHQFTGTTRKTWLILIGICAAYSVAAFSYLGNDESPQKFWQPITSADSAVFDLGEEKRIIKVQYHHGLGTGEYTLGWSVDGQHWNTSQGIVVNDRFAQFTWRAIETNISARYFKVGLSNGSLQLNELALRNEHGDLLSAKQINGPDAASSLFDEQNKTTKIATALNSMYFDEIYHARSAWEILQGIDASENTHPPLGKIIISVGVMLFGMNPFGFRFMGVAFGIMMLPVFFCLANRLFRSEKFALVATALLALDFMHFTQTRIATIDTYGVFFIIASAYWMLRFIQSDPMLSKWKVDIKSLFFCGVLLGMGIASKWIVIYHGAGLAVLYFWMLYQTKANTGIENAHAYYRWLFKTLLVSIVSFVVIPVLIYTAAYIPLMKASGQGLSGMLDNQASMWDYHSNMKSTHSASSPWYQWPIMAMPIWYYSGSEWTGSDEVSTIMAFGNPVTWYFGTIAFLAAIIWRVKSVTSKPNFVYAVITPHHKLVVGFILISGLAQFLPWAIIPRKLVFIYHFFASVPFIILALVWWLQRLQLDKPIQTWKRYSHHILLAVAALLFIVYFPVISGLPVAREWVEYLNMGPVDIYF